MAVALPGLPKKLAPPVLKPKCQQWRCGQCELVFAPGVCHAKMIARYLRACLHAHLQLTHNESCKGAQLTHCLSQERN